jgi:hypothetical protein
MQKTCLDFIEKANKKKFNKKLKSKNENGSKEKDKTISMDPKKKKEVQWTGSPSILLWVELLFLLKNTKK